MKQQNNRWDLREQIMAGGGIRGRWPNVNTGINASHLGANKRVVLVECRKTRWNDALDCHYENVTKHLAEAAETTPWLSGFVWDWYTYQFINGLP